MGLKIKVGQGGSFSLFLPKDEGGEREVLLSVIEVNHSGVMLDVEADDFVTIAREKVIRAIREEKGLGVLISEELGRGR